MAVAKCVKWKATQGCHDPSEAARVPRDDLGCDATPGLYQAGFCACSDEIPRYRRCGEPKRPCREVCTEPLSKSDLPSAFSPTKKAKAAPKAPWWTTHVVTIVVCAFGLVGFLAHFLGSRRRVDYLKQLRGVVRANQRDDKIARFIAQK